jgi:hypothetical protein
MSSSSINNRANNSSNKNRSCSSGTITTLLKEAEELAKNRNWTTDYALFIMYCRAIADRDSIRAERCIELLEREFENSI